MKRRAWNSKEKFQIVMEGLTLTHDLTQVAKKYKITKKQYQIWYKHLLNYGHMAFERGMNLKTDSALHKENKRLRNLIRNLSANLKSIQKKI